MKHFDKGEDYNERILQQQNMIAKEASHVQAVGYIPTDQISQKDWDEMVKRDRRIPGPNGYTYSPDDVYKGEVYNPRYTG